jgi:ABC-type branched-subunit amino acid transport system ATPase component
MIKTKHDTAIAVNDVSRHFGKTSAIDHVSLAVNKGELFGVLGPDGAGKTTLLRMMAAVMDPSNPEAQGLMGRISGMFHPPTGHLTTGHLTNETYRSTQPTLFLTSNHNLKIRC